MRLLKGREMIALGLAAISGVVLLYTSQQVQIAENQIAELEQQIEREEERIRMLQAEWAHLNRPERLERLANEFLDMLPASNAAMKASMPDMVAEPESELAIKAQPVAVKNPAPPKPKAKKTLPAKPEKSFDSLLGEISGGAP